VDLTGLAEKLCLQERLARLDPQELAAVYEDKTLPRASRVTASRRGRSRLLARGGLLETARRDRSR
jgi:hypothetical protein